MPYGAKNSSGHGPAMKAKPSSGKNHGPMAKAKPSSGENHGNMGKVTPNYSGSSTGTVRSS